MSENLFSTFAARLPSSPSQPFITRPNGPPITYDQLIAETGRMANALRSLGVKAGDRIAVQAPKSAELVMLYLATQRLGAVYVPLNTAYTSSELRYLLEDAKPSLFVCAPEKRPELASLAEQLRIANLETLGSESDGSLMQKTEGAAANFTDASLTRNDLAAILYTSGTTGRSKGAMLSHGNLTSNALTLARQWRFSSSDRLLHALPIFHTHGLFVAVNVTLMSAASMIFLPSFNVDQVMQYLPRATVMMGVPTFYVRLLAQPTFQRDLVSHMRLFVSGSAPLAATTHKEFAERTGHAILERYGMTETNMNSSNPYDGRRVPGSVGLALPGVALRVTDTETGALLPEGQIGQIEICGPNVFKGYWRQPEKTEQEFRADGFFISGDLGYFDRDGYLFIVGRHKDLIISGGFNVYPAEVESVIEDIPDVAQCAVIGVPHPDFGEAVVAIIVPRAGSMLDAGDVQRYVLDKLANYKRPKRVVLSETLPLNAMGKVQKKLLREQYSELFLVASAD